MNLERKVYETRSQKVGDFFLGVGLFIAVNVVLAFILSLGAGMFSGLAYGSSSGASNSFLTGITGILGLIAYAVPCVIQLALLIYFGLTRYWIALGILGAFVISLLLVLLATAACFGLIYYISGGPKP